MPLFIFDTLILDELENKKDARVQFIHQELAAIKAELHKFGSDLNVLYGNPLQVWRDLITQYMVEHVFTNRDYEPYATERDSAIAALLGEQGIDLLDFKDQIIFDTDEVMKEDHTPFKVFTPYSRKWKARLSDQDLAPFSTETLFDNFHQFTASSMPALEEMGFERFEFDYPDRTIEINRLKNYRDERNYPGTAGTSKLSLHLRFGTVSIRHLTSMAKAHSETWLNELIWRNFYQVIIWHFPNSIKKAFKPKYDAIVYENDEVAFKAWCRGKTGYLLVDAGMRELNETGFMHNRVRMLVASFLTKHLLIDWRWGEAYFAQKLLDYDLASNNGGWQWASGSGCDSAPYFRIFNPDLQLQKFDPKLTYVKKWVPEYRDATYPKKIVDHKLARKRALDVYKAALQ